MSAAARLPSKSKSRSADRANKDGRKLKQSLRKGNLQAEAPVATLATDMEEDDLEQHGGQGLNLGGLGFHVDANGEQQQAAGPADTPSPAGSDLEFSDAELLPDLSARPDLQDAPSYFLAGLRIQANQNRTDLKHLVSKSSKRTDKKIKAVATEVKSNSAAIAANHQIVIALEKANKNLEKQVGELNSALDVVRNRLDQLEKAERDGGLASTGPPSVASASDRPAFTVLGPNRFAGFPAASPDSSSGIDRTRFYGGSHPEMPKQAVQAQLEKLVQDFNADPDYGQKSGHLVVDAMFVPATATNWWIRFKVSLGKTQIDQGHAFKRYIYDKKVLPVGADEGTKMWVQPNRTLEERDTRKGVNCMLSYEHRIREQLGLPETYTKRGIPGALIIRAKFGAGHEAAFWKGTHIAHLEQGAANLSFISDEAIKEAFEADYATAGIGFNIETIKKGYIEHIAAREAKAKR